MAESDAPGLHAASLRHAAEMAVQATLPLLPLHGSWNFGYRVNDRIDSTLVATPEEWAEAAYAIAELHAALTAGQGPRDEAANRGGNRMSTWSDVG